MEGLRTRKRCCQAECINLFWKYSQSYKVHNQVAKSMKFVYVKVKNMDHSYCNT